MGLRLVLQPRPLCPAFYAISVRRLGTLPAASFRFHLAVDTLAVRLTLPTTKRVVDFHHQAIAHGGRTKGRVAKRKNRSAPSVYGSWRWETTKNAWTVDFFTVQAHFNWRCLVFATPGVDIILFFCLCRVQNR